jgi:hypothetical protein
MVPPYPGSGWSGAEGPGRKIWGSSGGPPPPPGGGFLLAFQGYSGPVGITPLVDISDHAWTVLFTSQSVGRGPDVPPRPCGAGGGDEAQIIACLYRAVVPGEPATVAAFVNGSGAAGMWVYQLSDADMTGIALAVGDRVVVLPGSDVDIASAVGGSPHALFANTGWGKVSYDQGWCTVPPAVQNTQGVPSPAMVTTTLGSELVNRNTADNCDGSPSPWSVQDLVTGTGTLTARQHTIANPGGAGAYACGWNTARIGATCPIGGSFAIAQQAHGQQGLAGGTLSVTLPSPP